MLLDDQPPFRRTISRVGSGLRIGVLALQGDFREHLRAAEAAGATGIGIRRPSELDGIDGLIIPGGESTTIDKLARAFELADPLRKLIADGLPVYGSCAGMILLADEIADPGHGPRRQPAADVRRPGHHRPPQRFRPPAGIVRD